MKVLGKLFSIQFLKFIIVGGINTLNGVCLSLVYSFCFQENLAFVCGYITSLLIAYLLNSFFTFKEALSISKYIKFCLSYIPNFIIQNIIVFIFLNGLGWSKIIVFGMAAIIGLPITFLLAKGFAFKDKS